MPVLTEAANSHVRDLGSAMFEECRDTELLEHDGLFCDLEPTEIDCEENKCKIVPWNWE